MDGIIAALTAINQELESLATQRAAIDKRTAALISVRANLVELGDAETDRSEKAGGGGNAKGTRKPSGKPGTKLGRPSKDPEFDAKLKRMWTAGDDTTSIAKALGLKGASNLYYHVKRLGLKARPRAKHSSAGRSPRKTAGKSDDSHPAAAEPVQTVQTFQRAPAPPLIWPQAPPRPMANARPPAIVRISDESGAPEEVKKALKFLRAIGNEIVCLGYHFHLFELNGRRNVTREQLLEIARKHSDAA